MSLFKTIFLKTKTSLIVKCFISLFKFFFTTFSLYKWSDPDPQTNRHVNGSGSATDFLLQGANCLDVVFLQYLHMVGSKLYTVGGNEHVLLS